MKLNCVLVTDYDGVSPAPERTKSYEPKRRPRHVNGYIAFQYHDDNAIRYFREISLTK